MAVARSTTARCAADNVPSVRISFAWGIVTRFCVSKTPARRKGTDTAASNREPRALVVCGTCVHQRPLTIRGGRLVQRVLDGTSRDCGDEYVSDVRRLDRKSLPFQQRRQFVTFKIFLSNRERATIG